MVTAVGAVGTVQREHRSEVHILESSASVRMPGRPGTFVELMQRIDTLVGNKSAGLPLEALLAQATRWSDFIVTPRKGLGCPRSATQANPHEIWSASESPTAFRDLALG